LPIAAGDGHQGAATGQAQYNAADDPIGISMLRCLDSEYSE